MRWILLYPPVRNIMKSVTFQVLSPVQSEADVFDHLIEVRRKDTGEEGLLLCSHYCRWPEDEFSKATWLEGCFTPEEYKDEPRLLLGYHRNLITHWDYTQDPNTGEVELKVYIFSHNALEVDLHYPQPVWGDTPYFPRRRVLDRLWRNASNAAPGMDAALESYYRDVVQLVERGDLHPLVASSYKPSGFPYFHRVEYTRESYWGEEGAYFIFHYDRIKVCENNIAKGYLVSIPLYEKPLKEGEIVGYCRPFHFPYRTSI